MIIYEANRRGLKVRGMDLDKSIQGPSLTGYLSNQELQELINHPESVGVRIYNSCNPDHIFPDTKFNLSSSRIVAVAVKADGYELTDRYLISNDAKGVNNHLPAEVVSDRTLMKTHLENAFSALLEREQYSSFFSREDIIKLIDPNLSFTGVSFYKTSLDLIDSERIEARMRRIAGRGFESHWAVPTNLTKNVILPGMSIPHFNFENTRHSVLSDRPCPGHCPTVTNVDEVNNGTALAIVEIGRNPAMGLDTNNDPYIVKWEHEN